MFKYLKGYEHEQQTLRQCGVRNAFLVIDIDGAGASSSKTAEAPIDGSLRCVGRHKTISGSVRGWKMRGGVNFIYPCV